MSFTYALYNPPFVIKKVFDEKYGNNYSYFITLHLNVDIFKAKNDERKFSEVTLKYILKTENKKNDINLTIYIIKYPVPGVFKM